MREDRCGPDGTMVVIIMPFPGAAGNYVVLGFSNVFQKKRLFLALCFAQREHRNGPSMLRSTLFCAGNAAMCFLPYVLHSESTAAALHSSRGYVLCGLANRRPAVGPRIRAIVSFESYVMRSERTAGDIPGSIWCWNTMFCTGWTTADDEKCPRWSQSRA